jgi:CheY-like chemotaxis protein
MPSGGVYLWMKTILVAEDAPALRRFLDFALHQGGFTVLLAADGQEAIALYKKKTGAVDLVLVDVRLPGMDGPQTLRQLQQIDPAVKCCFLTGGTGDYEVGELLALGAIAVFPKPVANLVQFVSGLVEMA